MSDLRDYEIIAEALERRESVQATCVARPNNVARGLVPRRAASEGDTVGLVLAALVVIVLLPLCFLAPEAFLRLAVQLVGHHVKTSFIERPIDAILDRGLGLR